MVVGFVRPSRPESRGDIGRDVRLSREPRLLGVLSGGDGLRLAARQFAAVDSGRQYPVLGATPGLGTQNRLPERQRNRTSALATRIRRRLHDPRWQRRPMV